MSESQDQNENTDLAFNIIAIILFIGFGIWAILVPDAMEEATPSGRHSAIKEILVVIWGVNGGAISLVLGVLLAIKTFVFKKKPTNS